MQDVLPNRGSGLARLVAVVFAIASVGANCEDPPPPPGTGAFILGARTVLPPPEDRVLRGGLGETLEGMEGLHAVATSISVVHRTVRDDPSTEELIELASGRQELELAGRLDDSLPRLLAFLEVPAGFIFQIRVVLESITVTVDGRDFDVHLPSHERSGYKIEFLDGEPFEIVAGERHGARVVFDPFAELIRNRGRGFILDPRVDAERIPVDQLLGFVADRVVVGFDPDLTMPEIDAINRGLGTTVIRCWGPTNYCVLFVPIELTIEDALAYYLPRDDVRFALPDTLVTSTADPPPDDPGYVDDQQLLYRDTRFYQPGAAPGAWDVQTGDSQVILALVDSGINFDLPDMIENIWINEAEIPPTVVAAAGGRDALADAGVADGVITFADLDAVVARLRDDGDPATDPDEVCPIANRPPLDRCNPSDLVSGVPGSGYGWEDGVDGDPLDPGCPDATLVCALDDVVGWSFHDDSNLPTDSFGHGTRMASIAAAAGNNGRGMAGAAWRVRVIPIENERPGIAIVTPSEMFQSSRSSILLGLEYASAQGAHIANLSQAALAHSDPNFDCGPTVPTYFLRDDEKMRETRRLLLEEMRAAELADLLLVVGAGNCRPDFGQVFDLDRGDILSWPGVVGGANGEDFPSMIRVASLGGDGDVSDFSGYGRAFVDIATPGEDHTALNFRFPGPLGDEPELDGTAVGEDSINGTSPAAAMTSGLAALVLAESPELRGDGCRIADRLLRNAAANDTISDRIPAGRALDALAATRDDSSSPVRTCP